MLNRIQYLDAKIRLLEILVSALTAANLMTPAEHRAEVIRREMLHYYKKKAALEERLAKTQGTNSSHYQD